jgi:putative acetyltransferase
MERDRIDYRAERPEDLGAIRQLNEAAFGRLGEANLVDRLRGLANVWSFVAVVADRPIAHVMFSPVSIETGGDRAGLLLGLAPLAVLPDRQRQGVGSALVRYGLAEVARSGCQGVVVLGNPQFYGRFGFGPAAAWGLHCAYEVPADYFMALALVPGAFDPCTGLVAYRPEFSEVE